MNAENEPADCMAEATQLAAEQLHRAGAIVADLCSDLDASLHAQLAAAVTVAIATNLSILMASGSAGSSAFALNRVAAGATARSLEARVLSLVDYRRTSSRAQQQGMPNHTEGR